MQVNPKPAKIDPDLEMTIKPRKMMALDDEDLQIISAHCQDAVLKVGDINYFPKEKRLIVEMNRFVWEKGEKQNIRVRSVLHFERVENVSLKRINLKLKDNVLALLAIIYKTDDAPAGSIELVFSGDSAIRLDVECVEAQLADMNAVWEASSMPSHPDK